MSIVQTYKKTGWMIWAAAILFYCYNIMLRMYPSISAGQITHLFNINATQFGFLTSSFYYSYTLMQIPVGLIVDHYKTRSIFLIACAICIIGQILFTFTHDFYLALAGRFIIGFGCAFTFVSALKMAALWLPKNYFAITTCITDAMGMLTAIFVDTKLDTWLQTHGYPKTMSLIIAIGAATLLLIFFFVRNHPTKNEIDTEDTVKKQIKKLTSSISSIIKNPQLWLAGLIGLTSYLPSSVLGDVWGVSYLQHVYKLPQHQASSTISMLFLGWIVASPFVGFLSDYFKKRLPPLCISFILSSILFALIIYTPILSHYHFLFSAKEIGILFFVIGMCASTHALCFVLAKENFTPAVSGTVIAVTNMIIMIGGIVFQPLVGYIIDAFSKTTNAAGVQQLSASGFSHAMAILPLSFFVSLIFLFFMRETGDTLDNP